MTLESAKEYATSIAVGMADDYSAGYVFGQDEDGNEIDAIDWLESEALDIQYIVDKERNYLGARILIAFGGPSAWLNTLSQTIEAAWWSETVYVEAPFAICNSLDDTLSELFAL